MIETTQQLKELMTRARSVDSVGLDTEFVWERTYLPRLGLVQLALSKDDCFLIDPLTIDDLSPLGELLADPKVVKIFHDAPGDLVILREATGADPQNIFDTRLAAGFGGFPSILSLLVLAEELLGVSLNKSQTRTNWLKRPLTVSQMKYGLEDVRYLRQIRRLILDRVEPEPLQWLCEELARLDTPAHYLGLKDVQRYTKIRGANRFSRTGLAILRALAEWREETARQYNKPRGHIIKDEVLLFIAGQELTDLQGLQGCEGISAKSISRYGQELVDLVRSVVNEPDASYPDVLRNPRLSKTDEAALRRLQGFISTKGEGLGVDPALLGNKAELKAWVRGDATPARQQEGWRKTFLAGFSS